MSHNLFGDPEMPIWTEQPQKLAMNYSAQNNSIHITNTETGLVVRNAMVHFWNEDTSQSELRVTDSNGNTNCSFDFTDVCVTKVNHQPLIKHIVPVNGEVWIATKDIRYDVIVPSGRSLMILEDANLSGFSKNDNARIIVEPEASLHIDNATITGIACTDGLINGNAIIVYGDLTFGSNVCFASVDGTYWDGLYVNNAAQVTLDNVSFSRCNFNSLESELLINGCSFSSSSIKCNGNPVTITNTDVTGSIEILNSDCLTLLNVTINNDSGSRIALKIHDTPQILLTNVNVNGGGDGIEFMGCRDYELNNCMISNNSGNGISIYETNGMYIYSISDCDISNNTGVGVRFYNSIGKLTSCTITNNNKGVTAYRVSNVTIEKAPDTHAYYRDSYIANNDLQEILFVDLANLFIDGGRNMIVDNSYDPQTFDRFLIQCPNMESNREIRQNYWGYRNQHSIAISPPESRFYPECLEPDGGEIGFYLDPVWEPRVPIVVNIENERIVYNSAIDAALDEDPVLAIYLFKQLISDFPGSAFAGASAKHMFALEQDKLALMDYYATEPNLHYNGEIDKIIYYLTTHCNIQLGNYQEAISWFEDVISNPPSELDSLMAVIDLGYVYTLMTGDDKASVTAMYPQLKPKSRQEYESGRESILSNLYTSISNPYGTDNGSEMSAVMIPVLDGNYPNPFNPTTTISFSLPSEMACNLDIYNIRGQRVKTLLREKMSSGKHHIVWDGKDNSGNMVSSGIYFYRLSTPATTLTSKMLLMK